MVILPNAAAVIRRDRRYLSEALVALLNDAMDTRSHAAIESGE